MPAERIARAYARLDSLTKPRRSLGYLEELAARYVAISGRERPVMGGKRICVLAGDHKVTAEVVSAYPSVVTQLMVKNFLGGGAAINVLARRAGAEVEVVDLGVAEDVGALPGLVRSNVKRGADNIARGPAMTPDEARQALEVGIRLAAKAVGQGVTLLGTGEMGIGNTTPAAALLATYLDLPVRDVVGPGTGLDEAGVARKAAVLERALAVNRARCTGALETLAALGGLEIAGLAGLCLGAAAHRTAVVVDGFIASAAALAALRLSPAAKDYMFFAHLSAEPGHRKFFASEGLRPIVDLGLRLGEGTGAAIAMQIIEDALAIYNDMATFAEAGIAPGA
ncbi:MAG: nicotinate-nucleotide--dimethylbenzimidazole phosphoribosyltransferase [Kiritimatiellaeota bacterium]|nr:nicotinate-nucleotide--dimethylbenzimidazole phosphoribosyltransferase [Kiritimatiellota bacterium]